MAYGVNCCNVLKNILQPVLQSQCIINDSMDAGRGGFSMCSSGNNGMANHATGGAGIEYVKMILPMFTLAYLC